MYNTPPSYDLDSDSCVEIFQALVFQSLSVLCQVPHVEFLVLSRILDTCVGTFDHIKPLCLSAFYSYFS
jgi:hypothetical protein